MAQRIFAAAKIGLGANAAHGTAGNFDLGRASAQVVIEARARRSGLRRSHRFD
jgi:hypothetical protein